MKPGKVALLQRDHELAEFTNILDELGIPHESFDQELPRIEDLQEVRLIMASTERLLESGPPHLSNWPRTIAVIQDPSKTLSAHLGRIGVSMILCRPIHPQAMRLILLHEVYRGPEKRVRGRTLIGQPVRLRAGLFSSKGTILDLSPSGARIQLSSSPKIGSKMRLSLGAELNEGKPLKLATQVVRVGRQTDADGNKTKFSEVGLSILDAKKNQKAIASILRHFSFGPGRWSDVGRDATAEQPALEFSPESVPTSKPTSSSTRPAASPEEAPEAAEDAPRRLPPSATRRAAPQSQGISIQTAKPKAAPEPEPEALVDGIEFDDASFDDAPPMEQAMPMAEDIVEEDGDDAERRTNLRVPYDRRIVALGEEAARVLVGQDLSRGGMRVLSRDGVCVGDLLKVALHCGTMMEPVVVNARAVREHGEEGMILNFEDLTPSQIEHLEKIVSSSGPIQYMTDETDPESHKDAEGPIVVGELLERVAAGDAAETPAS